MDKRIRILADNIKFFYGEKQALKDISVEIYENKVTALIGPSGCGKSTFIRLLNRMNDLIPNIRVEGKLLLDGQDIYEEDVDVVDLRRRVGMVCFKSRTRFQKLFLKTLPMALK